MRQSDLEISRRGFLRSAAAAAGGGAVLPAGVFAVASAAPAAGAAPLMVSTWAFGKAANDAALRVLTGGGGLLDAVQGGIEVVESDPKNPSVGLGGQPNAAGVVQLDACIMIGPGHRAGSVAAVEGIRHPIALARRVMERTPHVMLVGDGARQFAMEEGLESVAGDGRARHDAFWMRRRRARSHPARQPARNHDTIALLALDANGDMAGGCSTSGWGGKLPGRVGDSPIIGSGLYVDNEVGAAGATGLGENVMRYCGAFLVVEYMRQGLAPEAACLETIRRIARQDPKGTDLSINFVALDKQGRFGAAGVGQGFEYAVATVAASRILQSAGLTARPVGPEGGNRR
jgi:isoaspartyl peptidase/L-asparaginase-like protein (Ntn-hydrolase superfamily)